MSLPRQVKTIIVQSFGGLVALGLSFAGMLVGPAGLLISVPLGVLVGWVLITVLDRP
jgi:hypothetical protein